MNLEQIKQKPFHEPKDIGDEWRTPRALALGIESECGPFSYDLFTDGEINARFPRFITNGQNALVIDWCALASDDDVPATGFANPPYSRSEKDNMGEYIKGLKACMDKAYEEMQSGFKSVWLVPSATGAGWFPRHTATSIWYLEGRVTFEVPEWYNQDPNKPLPSSARGDSVVIIFDPHHVGKQTHRYPKTRDLIKRGEEIIDARDYNHVHIWLSNGVTKEVSELEELAQQMMANINKKAANYGVKVNAKQLLAQAIQANPERITTCPSLINQRASKAIRQMTEGKAA